MIVDEIVSHSANGRKGELPRGWPDRGIIGSRAAIAAIADRLPNGTPVIISSWTPPGHVYVLKDPELAAFLRFVGIERAK